MDSALYEETINTTAEEWESRWEACKDPVDRYFLVEWGLKEQIEELVPNCPRHVSLLALYSRLRPLVKEPEHGPPCENTQ